jgi:hypothetical protein
MLLACAQPSPAQRKRNKKGHIQWRLHFHHLGPIFVIFFHERPHHALDTRLLRTFAHTSPATKEKGLLHILGMDKGRKKERQAGKKEEGRKEERKEGQQEK